MKIPLKEFQKEFLLKNSNNVSHVGEIMKLGIMWELPKDDPLYAFNWITNQNFENMFFEKQSLQNTNPKILRKSCPKNN